MRGKFVISIAAAVLVFAGCAPRVQKPIPACPGKEFAAESLSVLRLCSENAVPLKANCQCILQYYADGRLQKENFPVKLWVNPPGQIYLQADVAFDPRGLVVGSNEDEFWLAVKLKEISSYYWGRWAETNYLENLMISPKLALEALGITKIGDEENWSLSNEGAFDVLTECHDSVLSRKLYVSNCDYLLRKIEYFDANGEAVVVTELDKYKQVRKDFFAPSVVKIAKCAGSEDDSVGITLRLISIKPANFTEEQRNLLFIRPEPKGFKHIYKIVDGDMIEQPP